MDEVRIVIKGEVYWLWRAIDSEGDEIDIAFAKKKKCESSFTVF
jgi:putative transposase